jgi:hypothetical protein
VEADYPMTAVAHETAPRPTAPWVMPGRYSVTLTSGGQTFTQVLTVKMDPRVKVSAADLGRQFALSKMLEEMRATLEPIGKSYDAIMSGMEKIANRAAQKGLEKQVVALRKELEAFANPAAVRDGGTLELDARQKVKKLFDDVQQVDAAPTPAQQSAIGTMQRITQEVAARWKTIPPKVEALNAQLASAGLERIKLP